MKMKLFFDYCCHLITGNSFLAIIWALHFDCKELVPMSQAGGYDPKVKLLKLRVNVSLSQALILGISLVANRQSVLSSKRSLVSNDHLFESHECFLIADGQYATSSERFIHLTLPAYDSGGFSPSRRMRRHASTCLASWSQIPNEVWAVFHVALLAQPSLNWKYCSSIAQACYQSGKIQQEVWAALHIDPAMGLDLCQESCTSVSCLEQVLHLVL